MQRHISDTHIMHWKIYQVHPQSDCMLLVETLCQPSGGCPTLLFHTVSKANGGSAQLDNFNRTISSFADLFVSPSAGFGMS